ncbi:MAG: TIGR01620 family protein [Mariprofundus sp.]|nr:TIGR01620 family protein [Mariprofundus sp.]
MPMIEHPESEIKKTRQGQIFAAPSIEQNERAKAGNKGQFFEVSLSEFSTVAPESITADEVLPNMTDYSKLKLDGLPLRGIKLFLVAMLLALFVYAGLEIRATILQAMEIHWTLAVLFCALVSVGVSAGLYLLWQLFGSHGDEKQVEELRSLAADIRLQHSCGVAAILFKRMDDFYHHKPQNSQWLRCKQLIPDYNDDREALAHIERLFLCKLDTEAQRRISKHSAQIGISLAASPWASVDMLLSFWRNLQMVVDVAQVYGVRPSLRNRYTLIRAVLSHIAVSGATEVAISELVKDVGGQEALSVLSSRVAQGLGVGIYSAKIGLAVMHVCRPILFEHDNAPSLADTASQLKQHIFT